MSKEARTEPRSCLPNLLPNRQSPRVRRSPVRRKELVRHLVVALLLKEVARQQGTICLVQVFPALPNLASLFSVPCFERGGYGVSLFEWAHAATLAELIADMIHRATAHPVAKVIVTGEMPLRGCMLRGLLQAMRFPLLRQVIRAIRLRASITCLLERGGVNGALIL